MGIMALNPILLYVVTVLIWGTTWFAIKLQVGHAPAEISIIYRGVLASLLLLGWCRIKGLSLRFSRKDHLLIGLLGLSLFSLHYLFIFNAAQYIVSGVIAIIFSGVSFFSIVNNYIFARVKPTVSVVLGAVTGVVGLGVFFWHEIASSASQEATLKGLMLAGIATLIFSFGGSITKRNHEAGLQIVPTMALGMVYGTGAMLVYSLTQQSRFVLPDSPVYWGALLYLVIPGSIIAFLCYLQLIKTIGSERAGYATVLAPMIALFVSWVFEGYVWSLKDLIGICLVIAGNILVMQNRPPKRVTVV